MSDNAYMDLWKFLRDVAAPEETANVDAYWYAHHNRGFYPGELNEAEAQILPDVLEFDPMLEDHPQEHIDLLAQSQAWINRQHWRAEVEYLIKHGLPRKLNERLALADYEVSARRLDNRELVKLTERDRAALRWDIPNEQLVGTAGSYGEIAFRRRTNAEAPDAPATTPTTEETIAARGKPGPHTDATRRMADDLLRKLRANEITIEWLTKTTAFALGKDYQLGETAALAARKRAIAQFRSDGIAGNSN